MAIERSAYSCPWSATTIRDCLLTAHFITWGMVDDQNKIVGFAIVSNVMDEAEILSMAITPVYQNNGLGQIFLDFILKKLQKRHIENIYLEVRASNKIAQSIYHKKGFEQIDLRKGYYKIANSHEREDALVLNLRLN